MLRALVGGVVSALLFVGACGDSDPPVRIPPSDEPDTGLTAKDASITQDATFSDGSPSTDSAAGDGTVVDAATDGTTNDGTADASSNDASSNDGATNDAATDAAGDAASSDAKADAPIDAGNDAAVDSGIPTSTLVLDEAPGANTYGGGLSAGGNWVSVHAVSPNAGTQWFGSGNGSSGTFSNLSFKKQLGGTVDNRTYSVSFWVVWDEGGTIGPIEFSNFTVLRIGGPNGTMNWTSTPTPTVVGQWVKWTGTYTPALADVGGPFYFEIKFDLPSKRTVGVDGPIGIE